MTSRQCNGRGLTICYHCKRTITCTYEHYELQKLIPVSTWTSSESAGCPDRVSAQNREMAKTNVPIKAYAFKPKGAADVPRLLIIFAEETKNIGSASALAKSLGYKDARAADDALVQEVLNVSKAEGSLSR